MSFRTSENTKLSQQRAERPTIRLDPVEGKPAQGRQQTGNRGMELRCLDDPLQRIDEPRLHGRNQEHLFEQPHITLPGLVADVDAAPKLRIVDQLAECSASSRTNFGSSVSFSNLGDVPQVAGQD